MTRTAPSFVGRGPASKASSNAKSKNRRIDTLHELTLRRELWRMGLRYRKHVLTLPGKPDIVFLAARVVVFCDGDFWHGRNWESRKEKLGKGANADYWVQKIAYNIERDQRNTKLLQVTGWTVIRLWETDIKFDPPTAAAYIKNVVDENRKVRQLKSHTASLDRLGNTNEVR